MSIIAPEQSRTVDPFSEERFSSTLNRFTRIFTGGTDVLIFDTSFLFGDELLDTTSYSVVTFGPGLAIKDDVLIHVTDSKGFVDFEDNDYYLDEIPGMIEEGNYYMLLYYNYDRSYPPPNAYYRILRDTSIFETYQDNYLFLGAAQVKRYGGDFLITESGDEILSEDGGYLITESARSPLEYEVIETWYYDPDNPTIGKRNYLSVSWVT